MGFNISQKIIKIYVKLTSKNFRSWGFGMTLLSIRVQPADFTIQKQSPIALQKSRTHYFVSLDIFGYQCFPKLPFPPAHTHLWIRGRKTLTGWKCIIYVSNYPSEIEGSSWIRHITQKQFMSLADERWWRLNKRELSNWLTWLILPSFTFNNNSNNNNDSLWDGSDMS